MVYSNTKHIIISISLQHRIVVFACLLSGWATATGIKGLSQEHNNALPHRESAKVFQPYEY